MKLLLRIMSSGGLWCKLIQSDFQVQDMNCEKVVKL
jgi:hypothetical protein